MTIKEFAKLAGVSVSTVSKIMNKKDESISAETREYVLKLAKEYNYTPYASIQTLNKRKTLTLGVVFRNSAEFTHLAIHGILSCASAHGYSVLLRTSNGSLEQEHKNISALSGFHVDGIIWEPVASESLLLTSVLQQENIPYVLINTEAENALNLDFKHMGYLATEELVKAQHTDIACYLKEGDRAKDFLLGYRQCLFEHGIPFNKQFVFYEKDGVPTTNVANHIFSGLVVSHYTLAAQLYLMIEAMHYAIPYDLSMVSLKDDLKFDEKYPPISTITIPRHDFDRYITETLIYSIEKKEAPVAPVQTTGLNNTDSIDIPYSSRLKKIVSVGSINIDTYLNFKELPRPGKTMITPSSIIHPGGKCINEAIGAAKLGHRVSVIGRVGDDTDTDFLFDYIKDYTVDTFGIKRSKGQKTGQAYIFVQEDGDSMISIMSGANQTVCAEDLLENERLFANAGYCLMQTEIPMEAVITAGELAKKHGLVTVLKPSACSSLPKELLKHIDILIPNLDELKEIFPGDTSREEKAAHFLAEGVQAVIVTMGALGAYLYTQTLSCHLPAANVASVDSSGAGDAFICALVSYLLYDYDLLSAAKIATYAAGLSTTRQGTSTALVDRYTLEAYIRRAEPGLLR